MSLSIFISYAAAVSCLGLAVGVLIRNRGALERWAFMVGMVALSAESLCGALSAAANSADAMVQWQQYRLLAASILPGTWLFFSLNFSRAGRERRLTPRLLLWVAAVFVPGLFVASSRQSLFIDWRYMALDRGWALSAGWPMLVFNGLLLLVSVAVLANLERTFRASVGTMRWRIKYTVLGVGLIFLARLYTTSQAVLFRNVALSSATIDSAAALLGCILILRSLFRAGHFDLEVYPSQSVLQGSVTIILAGIYLLIVGLLARVVIFFGGDQLFEYKALLILVLLVLLAVVLQSDHVRLQVRQFVSRHFRRPVYDYRTVWRTFTEGTATKMEQAALCRALVRLVADLFQTLSVSIWLVDESGGAVTLAASTSLDEHDDPALQSPRENARQVIDYFRAHPEPVSFEQDPTAWAVALRTWNPTEFAAKGGDRIAIPIIARGEVLGLITLGDRVGGVAFSVQDRDMLKCITEHAAANLLNAHLSKKFLEAKELESFQAMAAFFVHDLKNAASTLNLMLKNLPEHFDDPEFRADALRGISKTVQHINELTGRLNVLRQELKLSRRDTDLKQLIERTLSAVTLGPGIEVETEVPAPCATFIDADMIGKVLLNLVLNAGEAMNGKGQLRITAQQFNGTSMFTVSDTGCGMSNEFLRRSLFRPFQTTKKNGLGIGMFQCKAIVEAHGGKINVTSEAGKGTTVQVVLPANDRIVAT